MVIAEFRFGRLESFFCLAKLGCYQSFADIEDFPCRFG